MWARRESSPLRQRSTPSSTPATPCSFLKVGGVCESARRVRVSFLRLMWAVPLGPGMVSKKMTTHTVLDY